MEEAVSNGTGSRGRDAAARKRHFVVAQGDMPAAEIVRRAKAKGIVVSAASVYNIRSVAKQRANVSKAEKSVARVSRAGVTAGFTDRERKLLESIADVGLVRARELLEWFQAARIRIL